MALHGSGISDAFSSDSLLAQYRAEGTKSGERTMTTINRIEIRIPFPLKRVNCYYIKDSLPTLIDAGVNTEESFRTVESEVRKVGGTIEGLRRIILTHAHSDHIGLAPSIAQLSGADVYVQKWDAGKIALGEKGLGKPGRNVQAIFS